MLVSSIRSWKANGTITLTMKILCLFDPSLLFSGTILRLQLRLFVAKSECCQLIETFLKKILKADIFEGIGAIDIVSITESTRENY